MTSGLTLGDIELLEQLACHEARESFWAYRRFMNPSMKVGWFQRELSKELQQFYEDLVARKRPRLVVEAPPQHGKSRTITEFITWIAGKNPDLRTIYASFSERLGTRANLACQRIYDSERYKKIFPDTQINSIGMGAAAMQATRNRELLEYVGREGFFRNTTVRGSITGEGLDLGVIDDPIKGREQASSAAVRESTWDWTTDDFMTRFSDDAGLLFIMTRWNIDDPVGRMKQIDPTVKVISYPAIATEDEKHRKAGEALFPELKSLEFLQAVRKVMGVASWESLYQQRPFVAAGEFFKPDMISIVDALPKEAEDFTRAWDLASTEGGGDWTAGVKLGRMPDGRAIIADVVRGQRGPDNVRKMMKNTADRDGYGVKIRTPQDPGQAGKAQASDIARLLSGYSIKTAPVSGEKTVRAEGFAAQVNSGNVLMVRASWNDKLIDELRMFPNGPHDDQVDALADAFNEVFDCDRAAEQVDMY